MEEISSFLIRPVTELMFANHCPGFPIPGNIKLRIADNGTCGLTFVHKATEWFRDAHHDGDATALQEK